MLDVWHTDWELDFPHETEGPMIVATDIREVHVKKGRIWRSNFAWRRLPNLRKLRVVKPTRSWETGRQDEFMDMVKLELLDLSGNKTMQALPSLSGATGLRHWFLMVVLGWNMLALKDSLHLLNHSAWTQEKMSFLGREKSTKLKYHISAWLGVQD